MAYAKSSIAPPTSNNSTPTAALDWPAAFAQGLIEGQRAQLQAFASWQGSIAAMQQELWDEWVCHWGGGAPIDV